MTFEINFEINQKHSTFTVQSTWEVSKLAQHGSFIEEPTPQIVVKVSTAIAVCSGLRQIDGAHL